MCFLYKPPLRVARLPEVSQGIIREQLWQNRLSDTRSNGLPGALSPSRLRRLLLEPPLPASPLPPSPLSPTATPTATPARPFFSSWGKKSHREV